MRGRAGDVVERLKQRGGQRVTVSQTRCDIIDDGKYPGFFSEKIGRPKRVMSKRMV